MYAIVFAIAARLAHLAFGGVGWGSITFAGQWYYSLNCIAALCRHLGCTDAASSPTYSIINQYGLPGGGLVYHMDWYRLGSEAEAVAAGVEEALYNGHICLVEWPERAEALLPAHTLAITLSTLPSGLRTISWAL
ncbi:MAG: tRNA (adenosine(37)-N6)-threonylcarbamoyltransferase complex ATPase subunit type 1 TsaE [Bacteroidetes bacterium]|nr:MAG: tRNA (adenosine(37)-N6)-threonylcarbamoyltransferase complex ATPase subunit type 1 TsaE [Bacteroidota bacterium]